MFHNLRNQGMIKPLRGFASRAIRRNMRKPLKTERIQVLLSLDDLGRIDDWMFANRLRSRGEAIRRLIDTALSNENVKRTPEQGKKKAPP